MAKAPHIFLIDDEKSATDVISIRLEANGFKVSIANNPAVVLDSLKKDKPDLVLLDLVMPGMNGYEVLDKIRSDKATENMPVIMLTGKTDHADKIKALNKGLDDYITKPYDAEELIARIKAVLKRSRAPSEKTIKNILITGGAGFIGSALTKRLLDDGYNVTIMDDFSTGRKDNIGKFCNNKNFNFITGSITDETLVAKAIEECDMIYHLAATVGVKNVVDNPLETIIYDTIGTSIVLKYASANGVKVFMTSTSEVYGKSQKYPFKEDEDVVLGPPDVNRWSYACSKLLDEFFAISYYRQRGLPVVVVRLFNVVGPGQLGRYGMVIPRFFKFAMRNEPIPVYGDGTQVRCFTYIDDAIDMIIKLASSDEAIGEVINLGSENEISIKELAEEIKKLTKSSSKIVIEPYDKYYGANFQDIKKRVPDLTKLKGITGSAPKTSLSDILNNTKRYFDENPKKLEEI